MSFIVTTNGSRMNQSLFLVDRSKIKNRWWTSDWTEAMQFYKESAAKIQASKLQKNNPRVITINQAILLTRENERNFDYDSLEHPYSSEALGQD